MLSVRYIVLALAAWTTWLGSAHGEDHPTPARTPAVVVDLRTIGWAPPHYESNRRFFKDFSIGKLMSLDENTKVVFLSDDVIAIYHTRQEGSDWRTAARLMEAFLIRVKDGSLVSTMRWPTRLRISDNDLRDSECRLIPLSDGRFLVLSAGVMTLYSGNLELLKQQKLESATSGDMWAAQSVAEGHKVFLRHESMTPPQVGYSWLDSATLKVEYTSPGYRDRDFLVQGGVKASEGSVFTLSESGVRMIDKDQNVKEVCGDQLCREANHYQVLSTHRIGLSARNGFGIVDIDEGLKWSKLIESKYDPKRFQFSSIRGALSGTRFGLWLTGDKKSFFDGVKVSAWPPTILVYDTDGPKNPYVIRTTPVEGQLDFALSPNGTKVAVFDGAKVLVYHLD